ncbi:hypothetical protein V8F33_010319 [Rhypophila sp. PSN 637]
MRFSSSINGFILLWMLGLARLALASSHINSLPWSNNDVRTLLLDPSNKWSTNTTISFPDQESFSDATQRWSTYFGPTYSAAISPGTEEDVVKAVRLATRNNIQFLATGGRHGWAASLSKLKNGLAIDLGQLRSVRVDPVAATVVVGGGSKMNDVLDPVSAAGYEIQTGSCSCPGVLGVTLGGGVGRWQGLYGLMIDALLSVRLVTSDGRLLQVSETSYPDLFWGIRGAGANFGIVTAATFRLHKTKSGGDGGKVLNMDFVYTADRAPAYFKALETFRSRSVPANLAGITVVLYNETANSPYILANWVLRGVNTTEAEELMAPILAIPSAVMVASVVPWNKVIAIQGFGIDAQLCRRGAVRDNYGVTVRNYSASSLESAFEKMASFYATYPGGRGSALQFETFSNQAVSLGSNTATAYPWRDATGEFLFLFSWPEGDSTTESAAGKLGRDLRSSFAIQSGYPGGLAVYSNYAKGDEPFESIYGREKLPRLARLKRTWDPKNVFSFTHPLPIYY